MKSSPFHRKVIILLVAFLALAWCILPETHHAGELKMSSAMVAEYSKRYLWNLTEPAPEDTVFWAVMYPEQGYLTFQADSVYVLLLFTSPFALHEYTRSTEDLQGPFTIVGWSAETCHTRLKQIHEETPVQYYSLDRSTRCPEFTAIRITEELTELELTGLWLINRIASQEVGRKHYAHALAAIEKGEFAQAAETVASLISCTVSEDPRLHLLEGACGVAMGDDYQVARADDALTWLDPGRVAAFRQEALKMNGSEEQRIRAAKNILEMLSDVNGGVFGP